MMAAFKSGDIVQAFRKSPELQKFVLTGVTPTNRELGRGSYGSVEEVLYQHRVHAGKKLYETLINVGNEGVGEVVRKYLQECQLMSSLRHPNITQFLGICFLPGTTLPLLVMERLQTSLDSLLEQEQDLDLPLSLKCSILEDVASGLFYLHCMQPPIVHRDLTARNVLLTSALVAKITDLGNSRIINMGSGKMARRLTQIPGTPVYMPPEAQGDYGPSLDIFSFGHLSLYTTTQVFPGDLHPLTYINPRNTDKIEARTEIQRRNEYIELMESHIGSLHPNLIQLVKLCLHNCPNKRPSTEKLLLSLQEIKAEVESTSGCIAKPNNILEKIRLVRELKAKERNIEELVQQKGVMEKKVKELELMELKSHSENNQLKEENKIMKQQLKELQLQIHAKDKRIHQLEDNIGTTKDKQGDSTGHEDWQRTRDTEKRRLQESVGKALLNNGARRNSEHREERDEERKHTPQLQNSQSETDLSLSEPESPKINEATATDQTKVFTITYQYQVKQSWPAHGVDQLPPTLSDHTRSPPTIDSTPRRKKNTPLSDFKQPELMTSENNLPIRSKDSTEAKPKALPRSKFKSESDLDTQSNDKSSSTGSTKREVKVRPQPRPRHLKPEPAVNPSQTTEPRQPVNPPQTLPTEPRQPVNPRQQRSSSEPMDSHSVLLELKQHLHTYNRIPPIDEEVKGRPEPHPLLHSLELSGHSTPMTSHAKWSTMPRSTSRKPSSKDSNMAPWLEEMKERRELKKKKCDYTK